ncbi:unnamed protein product, partial [Durusdinium trenchii]
MDFEALVRKVRSFQKAGTYGRQAWNFYCDSHGEGVRDPRRHPQAFLEAFFDAEKEGLEGLDEWKDPDEIVREKVEIPLPEVSQEEVEAAAARLSHVDRELWSELLKSFPSYWQPIYETPLKFGYDPQKYDFKMLLS